MNKSIIRATTTGIIENISITQGDHVTRALILFSMKTREAAAIRNAASGDTSLSIKGLVNIKSSKTGIISTVSYQKGDFVQEGDELAAISDQNSLVFILEVPFELDNLVEKNRNCTIILPDKRKIAGTITGRMPEMEMRLTDNKIHCQTCCFIRFARRT